jgi:hypothetical protein
MKGQTMSMTIVILMTVMMGGTPQQIKMSETYQTMAACEAAMARVEQRYKQEHPDAKIEKMECTKS